MSLLGVISAKRLCRKLRRKSIAKKMELEEVKTVSRRKGRGGKNPEDLKKKREEAERKARRGEIDPMQEFTFHLIGQVRKQNNLEIFTTNL